VRDLDTMQWCGVDPKRRVRPTQSMQSDIDRRLDEQVARLCDWRDLHCSARMCPWCWVAAFDSEVSI
jgi:hypothetical protein